MSENARQLRGPTVDDLRVKLCYICLEEEHYDSPPDPPPVWTHPCKCTLIAHESCLLHWIDTQQRDFGRSQNEVKCPQCREFFEPVDHDPTVPRWVLNFVRRIVTWFYAGATIVLFGAGFYLTCATYGAFAVREFLGPDMFNALLTTNPALWPRHAWVNLPLIPFSLVTTCMPFLWTTHPLVHLVLWISPSFMPLLSPWPSSPPVVLDVASSSDILRPVHPASPRMWPPPTSLVCALFPYVRMLYEHFRTRVTRALVHDQVPARRQLRQVARQERPRRRDHQERLQRLQRQEQPNHNDFGAVAAALAICRMDLNLGPLICGALAMPTIARMMGAILLHLSHVVPFVRIIIASRPPPPPPPPLPPPAATPTGGLLGLWDCTRDCARSALGFRGSDRNSASTADIHVVTRGNDDRSGGFGTTILSRFLEISQKRETIREWATSQEWAMSDPIWWRNALGLCVFIVVKDALEILHLRLSNAQPERLIKSRPFSGVDLTRLDLIERHT